MILYYLLGTRNYNITYKYLGYRVFSVNIFFKLFLKRRKNFSHKICLVSRILMKILEGYYLQAII